jgi:hemoglobin
MTSLYEKLGGHDAVKAVVDSFYQTVLANPDVSPFFAETNMVKQRQHQTNFISFVLGGPNQYTGRNMREAHANLNLTDKEFNIIAELLSAALKKHGVSDEDIASVLKIVASTHDDILNL